MQKFSLKDGRAQLFQHGGHRFGISCLWLADPRGPMLFIFAPRTILVTGYALIPMVTFANEWRGKYTISPARKRRFDLDLEIWAEAAAEAAGVGMYITVDRTTQIHCALTATRRISFSVTSINDGNLEMTVDQADDIEFEEDEALVRKEDIPDHLL